MRVQQYCLMNMSKQSQGMSELDRPRLHVVHLEAREADAWVHWYTTSKQSG
jgi:hypothetical protein